MQGGPHRPGPGSAAKASRARARRAVRTPTAVRRLLRRPGIGVGASGSPQATAPLTMTRFHRAMSASTRARQLCPTMRPRSAMASMCRSRRLGAVPAVSLGTALERGGTTTAALEVTLADLRVDVVRGARPRKRRLRLRGATPSASPRHGRSAAGYKKPCRDAAAAVHRGGPHPTEHRARVPGATARRNAALEQWLGARRPRAACDRRTGGPQGSAPRVRGFSLARARRVRTPSPKAGPKSRRRRRRWLPRARRPGSTPRRPARRRPARHRAPAPARGSEEASRPAAAADGRSPAAPTAGPDDRGALLSDRWPGRFHQRPVPRPGRAVQECWAHLIEPETLLAECRRRWTSPTDAAAGTDPNRTAADAVSRGAVGRLHLEHTVRLGRTRPRSTRAIRARVSVDARRCRSACRGRGLGGCGAPRPDADY